MKDNCFITNCARGGIIDEEALFVALSENKIGGAALDVYEEEPPKDSKLVTLDNIVLTPHIAASTKEAQRDAAIIVADEILELNDGKTPKNVLNLPRIDNKLNNELNPYLKVSEKLGSFVSQSLSGKLSEVEIIYCGELANLQNQDILGRSVLQGMLNPILESPVNAINALNIAKSRGIKITEGKTDDADGYESVIKVRAKSKNDSFSAEGTFEHEPKIIKVNGYWVDVKPEGNMFIAKYKDVPGTIGLIGTKLGEHNLNIGIMQVGRDTKNGEAIMILTVDQSIPQEVVNELVKLDYVFDATSLNIK